MSSEEPAQSVRDAELEAIAAEVLAEVQPSVIVEIENPYAPPPTEKPPAGEFDFSRSFLGQFIHALATPPQYVVPQRFGMSAILGIVTALAILFGGLRFMDAHPATFLFFGIQSLVICFVQMAYGRMPRFASAVAGGIVLPMFILVGAVVAYQERGLYRYGPPPEAILCMLVFSIPFGAFLGYLTGTLAAGIFLVMDLLENYVKRGAGISSAK